MAKTRRRARKKKMRPGIRPEKLRKMVDDLRKAGMSDQEIAFHLGYGGKRPYSNLRSAYRRGKMTLRRWDFLKNLHEQKVSSDSTDTPDAPEKPADIEVERSEEIIVKEDSLDSKIRAKGNRLAELSTRRRELLEKRAEIDAEVLKIDGEIDEELATLRDMTKFPFM